MQLNQYYTDNIYSDFLVESINDISPNHAIDLGFGAGSLLHAAKKRWGNVKLIGVDIDERNVESANKGTSIQAFKYDGFKADLPLVIKDSYGEVDLLISNPPYFMRDLDSEARSILKEARLLGCISHRTKKIPAEVIFLAQNLRLLHPEGELGIILPSGIINGERWKTLRAFLFTEFNVTSIIQLPSGSFRRTDAQTFMLVINRKKPLFKNSIHLTHVDYLDGINVSLDEAINRADYSYDHSYSSCHQKKIIISENDFCLIRGNSSHSQLKEISDNYIHTTTMPNYPSRLSLSDFTLEGAKQARKNDILVARVGKRCVGRVSCVGKGSLPVSDCIIIIRPTCDRSAELIWEKMSTVHAKEDLINLSLGVGSSYLTHSIIKDYLTYVPSSK